MTARLIESLATTEALAELFSDKPVLQALLDFEVALARAQARLGIVPQIAVDAIAAAAKADAFESSTLSRDMLRAGTPGIPLVRALTERVRGGNLAAAGFVHWGATSQDVADTALVLLLKRAEPILASDLERLEGALRRLAGQHGKTVMLGRTLLQPAPPVTFGLKAAGWLGAIRRSRRTLHASFADSVGGAIRRCQRDAGVARRAGNCGGSRAGSGTRVGFSGRALAHPAGSFGGIGVRLRGHHRVSGKDGARCQFADARRSRRSGGAGRRQAAAVLPPCRTNETRSAAR